MNNTLVITWREDWIRAEKIGALRSESSNFPDKYDIDGELKVLTDAGLLDAESDVSTLHPLFARLNEYELRRKVMDEVVTRHQARHSADVLVSDAEATKLTKIGQLETDGDDTLRLHTRDAFRLFVGRARSPDGKGFPIVGGRKAAAALLALYKLSARGNPYADYALIQFTNRAEAFRLRIQEGTNQLKYMMQKKAEHGFVIKLTKSSEPMDIDLGFRSPYGYEIAYLVAEFDYSVRHIRTASMKAMISSDSEKRLLNDLRREARHIFEEVVKVQRILSNERLVNLTRADWLPTADETAKLRVTAATQLLGELPSQVYQQLATPKHHRMNTLTVEEQRLLKSVDLAQLTHVPDGADARELESAATALVG